MKKSLLISALCMALCSVNIQAEPWTLKDAVSGIKWLIPTALAGAATQVSTQGLLYVWRQSRASGESLWTYLFTKPVHIEGMSRANLGHNPGIDEATKDYEPYPSEIRDALTTEQGAFSPKKPVMLHGPTGTGKSFLARQLAYTDMTDKGQYFFVHQAAFDGIRSDATIKRFLDIYTSMVEEATPDGEVSVLHLEEFGRLLVDSTINPDVKPDLWKAFFEDFGRKHPKVRIIMSCNVEDSHFDPAVAGRFHQFHITQPEDVQRRNFFAKTGEAYYVRNSQFAATQACSRRSTQEKREALRAKFHVTDEQFQAAQQKHERDIAAVGDTSYSILRPWTWRTTAQRRAKVAQIKQGGYLPEIITFEASTDAEEQRQYSEATAHLPNFRKHEEVLQADLAYQYGKIKRMRERAARSGDHSPWTVDPATRTATLTVQDYIAPSTDEKEGDDGDSVGAAGGEAPTIQIPMKYGASKPRHRIRAAQQAANKRKTAQYKANMLVDLRRKASEEDDDDAVYTGAHSSFAHSAPGSDEERRAFAGLPDKHKACFVAALIPTRDLQGLATRGLYKKTESEALDARRSGKYNMLRRLSAQYQAGKLDSDDLPGFYKALQTGAKAEILSPVQESILEKFESNPPGYRDE